jgi:hypothetical protein
MLFPPSVRCKIASETSNHALLILLDYSPLNVKGKQRRISFFPSAKKKVYFSPSGKIAAA